MNEPVERPERVLPNVDRLVQKALAVLQDLAENGVHVKGTIGQDRLAMPFDLVIRIPQS
jgi:hypothetical protein